MSAMVNSRATAIASKSPVPTGLELAVSVAIAAPPYNTDRAGLRGAHLARVAVPDGAATRDEDETSCRNYSRSLAFKGTGGRFRSGRPERAQVAGLQHPPGRTLPRGADHRAAQLLGGDHRPGRDRPHQRQERPEDGVGDPRPARLRDL